MTFALDHIVINTLFDMDRAAALMSQLGFTVTPRGYHSLGSINHLMMFENDYLELIGLPTGTDRLRQDVLESPRGLNGVVFKVGDADASQHILRDCGLAMLEPQSFSRPVTIDGVEHLARFRTVRAAPEQFAAGRVYYCQHDTPELVWYRPWLAHPNGVRGLSELVIVTSNAEIDVPRYAKAAQSSPTRQGDDWIVALPGGFRLTLMSPARYRARYGELCVEANGRSSFFGATVLDAPEPARIGDLASSVPDIRVGAGQGTLRVLVPFLNTLLEFRG
ncbi:MAG TPA: VOC family protein [Bradyrhizobium sp.]|uniref:VOC family protein n=1 Tax=Bradyrhizobium sp. TaxID=376 RepID=UPI002D7FB10D|nr:VOC family protein [Bradyrhizobium sp.]HET7886703.1 VOC family protein [Bradyrhizobium sp.]